MNTLVLLMALVGLAYASGLYGRSRALRSLGVPTASAWVILGILLGPGLLGVIDSAVQNDVAPMIHVVVGWVALVIGLDYGVVRNRRLRRGRLLLGALFGIITVSAIALAAWWAIPFLAPSLPGQDRWLLALGLGAVGCETTSNAVLWVTERNGNKGPLSEILDDLAEAKDFAPILAAGVALCLHPRFELGLPPTMTAWAIPGGVVAASATLGICAAVLLRREDRVDQAWGIIVGTSLLAIGTAARLALPVMLALFVLGLVIGVSSRHRVRLLLMVQPTKRSALLPAILLAGARVGPMTILHYSAFLAVVMVVRVIVLTLIGHVVAPAGPARAHASLLGLAMLPAGALTMTVGISFAVSRPGFVGDAVLVTAIGVTILGELIGPFSVRAALRGAGEITGVSSNSVEIVL